jgi:ABC-type nitrate/sulfonate/bicarbonate transport system ATPase subunit
MIAAASLSFGYRGADDILRGFSWTAGTGEVWAVLGPSGCGKTTLLYLLAGLRRPTSGQVLADGEPVTGPRRATGLILQDLGLLPWATVRDNAVLGLRIRGVPGRRQVELVDGWLERLGLADLREAYPAQLSGGQRQRVAIARTLVLDPDVLLMDEPFASLDAFTREDLQDLLLQLARGMGERLTTVLVTHDIGEAVFVGRRILVLQSPPIAQAMIIDNPLAGVAEYRLRDEYYQKVLEVRAAVRQAKEGRGAGRPSQGALR